MSDPNPRPRSSRLRFGVGVGFAVGVAARLLLPLCGYNFDVGSYMLVVKAVAEGHNVYAATPFYNYGPVWFNVLRAVYLLAGSPPLAEPTLGLFRWLLAPLLTLTDLGIAWILGRRFGVRVALFFFLNPWSVFITGYHRQFDNLALLFGLAAAVCLERWEDARDPRHRWTALGLLGLSLATKHLLVFWLAWLALRERSRRLRATVLAVPTGLFLLAFLPWAHGGRQGILHNVLLYRSRDNGAFWQALSAVVPLSGPWRLALFAAAMALLGVLFRRWRPVPSLLAYAALLVVLSPAATNQYFAIPSGFLALQPNPASLVFAAAGTVHELIDVDGLKLGAVAAVVPAPVVGYGVLTALLAVSVAWTLSRGTAWSLGPARPVDPGGASPGNPGNAESSAPRRQGRAPGPDVGASRASGRPRNILRQ